MAIISFKGMPVRTAGDLPPVGSRAPDFVLTGADLQDRTLRDFAGRKKVLNIVPSLDTGVCAASARRFNQEAGRRPNVVVINISVDLPFAQKRFCDAERLEHVVNLSAFRSPKFGEDYGVRIVEGPLTGLMSRAVIVLDAQDRVVYTQQVPEIVQEPDYDAALAALDRA